MENLVRESLELIDHLSRYTLENYLNEKVQKLKNNLDIILTLESEKNEFDLAREQIFNSVTGMHKSISNIKKLSEKARLELSYCDSAINDLLHAIEIIDCDDSKLLEYTIKVKELTIRRRKVKDFMDISNPFKKFSESPTNNGAVGRIHNLSQTVTDRNKLLKNKTYTVRVLKEIQKDFDKVSVKKTLTNK